MTSPPFHNSTFILLNLWSGLALGACAGWAIFRAPTSVRESALAPAPPPVVLPAWSWREADTPSALVAADAAAAIAAWSALRAPDGRAADFATRADALRTLLVRLPPEAFARLLAALAPDRSPAGLRLLDVGFDAWVEVDPAAATRWAVAANPGSDELTVRGIRAWGSQAPEEAAAWACSLSDPNLAARLAGWALASLANQDPARALALANSRDDAFRAAVFRSIIGPLSKADPAAAVQAYGPLIWENGRGFSTLEETLRDWAGRDPSAAITWLCAQPHDSSFMLAYRVGQLARHGGNREAIATVVATHPNLAERQSILVNLLSDWQNEKPTEALTWLKNLNDPDRSAQLLFDAMHRSTPAKPEVALTLALGLPEGEIRTMRLGRTLAEWAERDPGSALAWIKEHSEPGVAAAAAEVHATLLADIARDEPATALAEWRALSDPRSRAAALLPIMHAWGESDPAAALAWYGEQKAAGEDEAAPAAATEIFSLSGHIYAWAKKDPEAALRWAEKLHATGKPSANTPDWMRLTPFFALGGNDNEAAPRGDTADLYTKIRNPELRVEVLTKFVRNWLTTDPDSAKAWLERSSALTPAQAAALLAPAK